MLSLNKQETGSLISTKSPEFPILILAWSLLLLLSNKVLPFYQNFQIYKWSIMWQAFLNWESYLNYKPVQHGRNLEIISHIHTTGKSWTRWKSTVPLRSIRELRSSADRLKPHKLKRQTGDYRELQLSGEKPGSRKHHRAEYLGRRT